MVFDVDVDDGGVPTQPQSRAHRARRRPRARADVNEAYDVGQRPEHAVHVEESPHPRPQHVPDGDEPVPEDGAELSLLAVGLFHGVDRVRYTSRGEKGRPA